MGITDSHECVLMERGRAGSAFLISSCPGQSSVGVEVRSIHLFWDVTGGLP